MEQKMSKEAVEKRNEWIITKQIPPSVLKNEEAMAIINAMAELEEEENNKT